MKKKLANLLNDIKDGVKNYKVSVILGIFIIVPVIISLRVWEGNAIIGLVVVPVSYRLICNLILWIMAKAGKNERRELFNTISRLTILLSFLILAILSTALGHEKMGFIEIILVSVLVAYFDVVIFAILKTILEVVFGLDFSKYETASSSYKSVNDLLNNTKTSFDRGNGTKIYQDSNGKTIGRSIYDEKTNETKYWNDKGEYIGKSSKDSNSNEKYWDSNLNYKGQSEENSNGTTSYYDEDLNYKGRSKNKSNGTSTFVKK